jgi:hypothetical protein
MTKLLYLKYYINNNNYNKSKLTIFIYNFIIYKRNILKLFIFIYILQYLFL